MLFCASSEGSGELAHLHRLTLAFVIVLKSHVLPQMAMCVLFTPAARTGESTHLCRYSHWTRRFVLICHVLAAKALAILYICTGIHMPRHSNEIASAGSNGDLCTIYVKGECCGESALATTAHLCKHQCVVSMCKKWSQCVAIKFLNKTFASLPRKK